MDPERCEEVPPELWSVSTARRRAAHARVLSRALQDEQDCEHRSCPSAAVRDGYGQRRPPSRASSSQDGSSRTIAAAFLKAGPAWDAARLGAAVPPGATSARQPPWPRACASDARWPAWHVTARAGARHAAQRAFLEGGRAGLSLVAAGGPRARSARGRRARHAPCRSAVIDESAGAARRVPGAATFRSRPA
jgi:hypothetical protein